MSQITNNDDFFSFLPGETIGHIFSYLTVNARRIREVCKRWNSLAVAFLDPNIKPKSWLIQAIELNHQNLAINLIVSNLLVNPAENNNEAIQLGSKHGHVEVVKELLKDKRVDPSADNNYAIRKASALGYVEVVRELLKHPKVDPAENNNEAMKLAGKNGHNEVVKVLLAQTDLRLDSSENPTKKRKT
ncbi:MAG: ankyrin repeat domain-containing protein [Chlamydiae bacterium]|nr:ankyrin repeat domain-containing protein [Chlamydiota bacterium]